MPHKTHISIYTEEKTGVILVGNSGAGKGTFARSLAHLGVGYGYMGTGDLLRQELVTNPSLAKIINSYTSTGEHVPLEVMRPLVKKWFMPLVPYRLVIKDGFPRNVEQIDDAFLLFHENGFVKVVTIYIDKPADKCAEHLIHQAHEALENGCKRNDTEEKAITARLSTFDKKVKPILKVLEERSDKYVRVDTRHLDLRDRITVRDIALEAEIIHL